MSPRTHLITGLVLLASLQALGCDGDLTSMGPGRTEEGVAGDAGSGDGGLGGPATTADAQPPDGGGQSSADGGRFDWSTDLGDSGFDAGADADSDADVQDAGSDAGPAPGSPASLSLGINLGNSLDAPESETIWGNPKLTPELVKAMADAGFDVIRIPVTWSKHMGGAPGYTIQSGFLERVEEVVEYVTDLGLTAVINVHHDGKDDYDGVEWLSLNNAEGAIDPAHDAAVRERFVKVWTQIAGHFADHGPRLWFESMNEIHDGWGEPDPHYYDAINELNQAFVDTVRASGGHNPQRYLVVPGYNTNIDYTLEGFELPDDTLDGHLILSVHYYDPWGFAGAAETQVWGADYPGNDGWGQEDHVIRQFDSLKKAYVDQGVPVFIGEFGAVHQAGYENYRRYFLEYVTRAARERGLLPVYWDNGASNSGVNGFGLFNRHTAQLTRPTMVEAMVRAAAGGYSLDEVAKP